MKKFFLGAFLVICFSLPVMAEGMHGGDTTDLLMADPEGGEKSAMHHEKKSGCSPDMMAMCASMKGGGSSMVASSDGGVIVLSAGKLTKFDKNLTVVKEVSLAPAMPMDMGMKGGMKMCPIKGRMKMDASETPKEKK